MSIARTRRLALAGTAVAAVLLTAGCSWGSVTATSAADQVPAAAHLALDPQAAVVKAASSTRDAGSAHIEARVGVTVAGTTQQVAATGSVDWNAGTAELTATLPAAGSVHEIVTPDAVYVQLPGSTQWRRLPVDRGSTAGTLGGALDGSRVLADLAHVGQVTRKGPQTIGGVATTRYDARVDAGALLSSALGMSGNPQLEGLLRLAAGAANPGRVSVWLDASGRLVQVQESFTADVPMMGRLALVSTVRFTRIGEPVTITPPADATTVTSPQDLLPDLGSLLGGLAGSGMSDQVGQLLGGLLGSLPGGSGSGSGSESAPGSGGGSGSAGGLGDQLGEQLGQLLGGLLGDGSGGSGLSALGGSSGHARA